MINLDPVFKREFTFCGIIKRSLRQEKDLNDAKQELALEIKRSNLILLSSAQLATFREDNS